jgi:nucleotide-binding universal stress UspA family protein
VIRVEKILYPTDFSSYSNQAYFHAIALAEQHQARVTVLYVCSLGDGTSEEREEKRNYWRQQLEQIRPMNPSIPVHHVLLEGEAADQIVRYARDSAMDLIVMGTHGRTGEEREVLGSVAEEVLRNASCSVLVVKMPKGIPGPIRGDVEVTAT